ncbi:DUF302 domain-containing protein [Rhizobium sp. LCM 4573]|uniref:DUF302 domain-containing protein n=1 Tax=Rhizobium sp. LCM 4573 TaxID=1848291 RepID=UPI0008D93E1C|nr:DUF302 domain-containing protein [Rhizobium sp. LCM 4573]OHV82581.1 hypothetical protein LCM4573_16405 [Rhizobium sp. LCM 4573]
MVPVHTKAFPSRLSFKETLAALLDALSERHIKVFATIDYTTDAAAVGIDLLPTTLVIFGNPEVGSLLVQDTPTTGLDLPLKVLVWSTVTGETWLAYNDPMEIGHKNAIGHMAGEALVRMGRLLESVVADVSARSHSA